VGTADKVRAAIQAELDAAAKTEPMK